MHINYWGLAGMVVIILAIIGCYIAAFDIEKHIDIFRIPCRKAPNDIRLTENGANIQLAVPAKPGDPFLTTQVIKLNREDGSHCTVTVIVRDDRYRPKPKAVTPGKIQMLLPPPMESNAGIAVPSLSSHSVRRKKFNEIPFMRRQFS